MPYLIYCHDKPQAEPVRKANRDAHLAYVQDKAAGKILLAGPLLNDEGAMVGSMLCIDFAHRAEAEDFAANDPYAKAGLFQKVVIHGFRKVFPSEA